ncbi:YczE/YyaS/YitT family protein [Tissierella creatinophila]|uniref:BCR, YitT family n=1 Tax=Tissierella creatinophila DSM 6911 TaxID=1123403 RepID=A0A1U7M5P6_TISCR|nr:hypothetical protein [Tissierella creatinophila]OLS02606.1 hypothetical protein TICRE_14070 [Tissierella creatinophila DSM 6911]
MQKMMKRYFKLILGFFIFAIGIVITINANLGYAPWDVFHQGVGNILNIKIGTANILVGLIMIIVGVLNGKKIGIGSILNMLLIGAFINIIMSNNLIPIFLNTYIRLITIPIGMIIMGFGTFLYIDAGFGAGPRDSLMIILIEKTNKSVSFIRNAIEITVLVMGYLLGGPVGIGTVIISLGLGFAIEFVFKILKFDPKAVVHRGLNDEIEGVKSLFKI